MARFSSALVALAAGILVAFDAASSLAAPLARDATSAPRLEQRRGLLESAAEARAEPELVNIVGAVGEAYQDADDWSRKAALNIARVGGFSSDRTVREYASEVWGISPCKVEIEPYKSTDPV